MEVTLALLAMFTNDSKSVLVPSLPNRVDPPAEKRGGMKRPAPWPQQFTGKINQPQTFLRIPMSHGQPITRHRSKFEAMRLAPQFTPVSPTADVYRIAGYTDGLIGAAKPEAAVKNAG